MDLSPCGYGILDIRQRSDPVVAVQRSRGIRVVLVELSYINQPTIV